MTFRIGSLCAGYGGLDMGVSAVLDAEPVWFCEYAAGPSKILAHHYPDLPNYHDLTTTDWSTVPPVDILTAGWPCQPWSLAGARKGADDERAIWPSIADAIRSLRPRYIALENVSAIVGVGELARAVGDLAALGYDAQWQCVRASDIGAPHRRERCFILAADAANLGYDGAGVARAGRDGPAHSSDAAANAEGNGRDQRWAESARQFGGPHAAVSGGATTADAKSEQGRFRHRDDVRPRGDAVGLQPDTGRSAAANSSGARFRELSGGAPAEEAGSRGGHEPAGDRGPRTATDWGPYRTAIERWERIVGRPAPAPTELSRNGNGRLSPLLVEWMMGLPEGWVTAVPDLSRNEQLKALGNGVVPQQAAYAFAGLLDVAVAA